ncbi:MAG: cytidine deaminase [Myxococcaceae bacterium]
MSATPEIPWERLFEAALGARANAYAPYSHFRVGAAAMLEDGRIVSGCNVENASYGLTVCAERNAVAAAVALGKTRLRALALVSSAMDAVMPCGACRQVLSEFAPVSLAIRTRGGSGAERVTTLGALLPDAFGRAALPASR